MTTTVDRDFLETDLTESALFQDGFPHDIFTAWRRHAPVRWQPFPEGFPGLHDDGFWVLSKHDDIQAVSRKPELFCAYDGPQLSTNPGIAGNMLVSMDGRDHIRQRRLISAGFTPRMVNQLNQQIRFWAESIVDRALELEDCDFVSEIAYKLPMNVIADIVGIPVEDRSWLFSLTNDFLQGDIPEHPMSPEDHMQNQLQMFGYAQKLGQEKRTNPQDDVWTILSTVEVDTGDGGRTALSQTELDFFFLLLIVAGSETTRNAVSQGLVALLEHPDQLERLRKEPEGLPVAVEEVLRWSSPVGYFARRATRDTDIRGVHITEGDRVTMWFPSGNRDEDVFDEPFRFDVQRNPNPHVAFGGGGAHYCLGANLAKRELVTLLEVLFERTQQIELAGAPAYTTLGIFNPILLFMAQLPVHVQ
jgi:cytochrome P450